MSPCRVHGWFAKATIVVNPALKFALNILDRSSSDLLLRKCSFYRNRPALPICAITIFRIIVPSSLLDRRITNGIAGWSAKAYQWLAGKWFVAGSLLPGARAECEDVWKLGAYSSTWAHWYLVARIDSGCDQASSGVNRSVAAALPRHACVGITNERFPAIAGRITVMSGLIAYAGQIWLAVDPVDIRRGMDGLSMIVQ